MALAAVQTAMNNEGDQSLHPFFSKPPRTHAILEEPSKSETLANNVNDDPDHEHAPSNAPPAKARKKRARKSDNANRKEHDASHIKNQLSLERFTKPAQSQHVQQPVVDNTAETALEDDLNMNRKKRRKTASPPADDQVTTKPGQDWHQQLQIEAQGLRIEGAFVTTMEPIEETSAPLVRVASPQPTTTTEESADAAVNDEDVGVLKKQIKITKSGKLVSSPPNPTLEDSTTAKKRRGRRPAKAKAQPTVTIIRYGIDAASRHAIGGRIDAILAGIKSSNQRTTANKKASSKPVEPPKSTHPFFLGKAAQTTEDIPGKAAKDFLPSVPRRSAVTPGKLRAEAQRDCSPQPMPTFGTSSGPTRVINQAGLLQAAWPTREVAHVRNLQFESAHQMNFEVVQSLPLRTRKLKNRVVGLEKTEEIISTLARDIAADIGPAHQESKFDFNPPEDVRLPKRLLTTGIEIQRRVHERLKTRAQWFDEQSSACTRIHPAVESLLKDIEHTLTPFDEGRCEGQTWAQKYSPKCASHVLSEQKDALVLRDWLQSLTVMTVGGTQDSAKIDVADVKFPPKKKRKKDIDDFIVSDDEEEDEEMVEIPGGDDTIIHTNSYRRPRWTRNNNVIVISGPHGCGKSATVYAVAKELDFEIFEINSGTRRSGKDIQDRVGDMTANHLVNHKRPESGEKDNVAITNDADNDAERMDTAFRKDIDSGRQGTMMTFFKSNGPTKPRSSLKPQTQEAKRIPAGAQQNMQPKLHGARKSQKQSLILFEEADMLFEDDQQFWAQVTRLAAHSKRPIVITCNDEKQIPLQDLPLAAVLRLRPSRVDLATDYMLVLAGREGHILERDAVRHLYESKNHDLRASITELNLWCQMAVGDRKGGLEWMYQRWPPGKDVDADGRLLRVASEGTYCSGMGWLSHNIFESTDNSVSDREEELLKEVWADWSLNPGTWGAASSSSAGSIQGGSGHYLEQLENFTDALSAADVFCRVGLPSYECELDQPADPTLPPIFDKSRLSYTLAAPLLQADHQTDFLQLDTSICTQTHLLARRTFPELANLVSISTGNRALSEIEYTTKILHLRAAKSKERILSRPDFSDAMDCLAALPDQTLPERTSFILTPSSFDRSFSIITLDLAPYVRSIVAHEQTLETQRVRMSNLLSAGGTGKRARTTRASRAALEGGIRETKRRDRWFEADVNFELVMATAGQEWAGMGWRNQDENMEEESASVTGTQESFTSSQDVVMHDAAEEPVTSVTDQVV